MITPPVKKKDGMKNGKTQHNAEGGLRGGEVHREIRGRSETAHDHTTQETKQI